MIYRKKHIKLYSTILLTFISFLWSNQVQLITTHKKSNGTLLRIVTSAVIDIENIAGWKGQENWFYITLNGTRLSSSSRDYITFEPPLIDIEITENNESVQLGYLFEKPIEDFEIFHSNASRVILIQVWESLNDSVRYELRSSEEVNQNRVFSLPKNESKGSPFYDSFVYAKEKYGSFTKFENRWIKTKNLKPINYKDKNIFSKIDLFEGRKYKWGGKNSNGVDCSALVQLFFNFNNKFCPRDTKDQLNYFKKKVKLQNIKKNDLIYWQGHVAIVLSKNKLIHAYGPSKKVLIMNINYAIKKIRKTANLKVLGIRRAN